MKKERKFRFVGNEKQANYYSWVTGRRPKIGRIYLESEEVGSLSVLHWASHYYPEIRSEWEEVFEEKTKERKFRFVGFNHGRTYSFDPEEGDVFNENFRTDENHAPIKQLIIEYPNDWEEVFEEGYHFKCDGIRDNLHKFSVDFGVTKSVINRLADALREAEQAVVKLGEEIVKLREIIQDEKTN
jgi:hypothetical protein